MKTLDLRKELKPFYNPPANKVVLVTLPRFQFAMLDGALEEGKAPAESAAFQEGLAALYGIAYTLKFMSKLRKEDPIDYPVMALEGLWWSAGGAFNITNPGDWRWTLMMLLPEHINAAMFNEGLGQLRKKRGEMPEFNRLRLESFEEGLCVQTMHVGPYATEPATIKRMHDFASEQGLHVHGKHHEIYLGDPRRSSPETLKTVLRQPVEA